MNKTRNKKAKKSAKKKDLEQRNPQKKALSLHALLQMKDQLLPFDAIQSKALPHWQTSGNPFELPPQLGPQYLT